jgi:DCN1-like protein 1/2
MTDNQKSDLITVDGTMQLCQDLGIEPTELDFLLISYHLGSERMGEFTREAFTKGLVDLQVDSIENLKTALNTTLKNRFETAEGFRKVYSYAFLIGRQTGQKSLCKKVYWDIYKKLREY